MRAVPHLLRASPLLLLAACAARPSVPPAAPLPLTLVATNDLHGWVQPHEARLGDGRQVRYGGLAVFGSYLEFLRQENPGGVLLLDAGDLFQGTLVANLTEGEAVIAAYNALGYDAATLGNHEFDYGPVGPRSAAVLPGDDPLGALAARAAQARFPLLARNLYIPPSQRPPFLAAEGLHLVERHGVRIGIVGLITPLTPQVTNPVNVSGFRFGPLAEEARSAAAELRRRGAEVLVALVHAGGRCTSLEDAHSLTTCDPHGEVFEMLQALPEGLFDTVIAAHTHTRLAHFVHGTPVLQSGAFGTQFGVARLAFDPRTRRVDHSQTQLRSSIQLCEKVFAGTDGCDPKKPGTGELVPATFLGKPVVPDARIEAVLAPYLERVQAEQRRPLNVTVPKTLVRNRTGESPLGNALADALRAMEQTDLVLLNSGGLRSDLPEGALTFGALYEVFPFDNTLATLQLTGAEFLSVLEELLSSSHGAPQVSGLKIDVARCPKQSRILSASLPDGRPFDRSATYRVTTSDFLALGGDGVGRVLEKVEAARKDFGHRRPQNMRDALASWLEKRGGTLEAELDGRLQLRDSKTCDGTQSPPLSP